MWWRVCLLGLLMGKMDNSSEITLFTLHESDLISSNV